MTNDTIYCALSGIAATDEEMDLTELMGADEAPGLPAGWMEIKLTVRSGNPRFADIQMVKGALVAQVLASVPKKERREAKEGVAFQIDAQFAALEARGENAPTLLDTETLYIAPAERVDGLREEISKLFGMLGIEAEGWLDDEDDESEELPFAPDEDDEEEEEAEEEEGVPAPATIPEPTLEESDEQADDQAEEQAATG
jgi:hypothetical protein